MAKTPADAVEPRTADTAADVAARSQTHSSTLPPVTGAAPPHTPVSSLSRVESAPIDEVVPPSDASASSPPSSPPAGAHRSTSAASAPHTRASTAVSPSPAVAVTTTEAASDHPRLKVVIPPVPPFLHEVDKRNERERVRRMQRVASAGPPADTVTTSIYNDDDDDADAAFHTPEKQVPPPAKRKARDGEALLVFEESEYRMSQITPPPSERMLDYKNPPLPPRKAKKRRRIERPVNPVTGRMRFSALPLPRLSLSSETSSTTDFSQSSPPRLDTPPGSPVRMASVFRSLADEFAAVQDTPPLRTLRAPPRITRAARQCTPPISSRTRSAIQTPTTTMVLRSRQLNPSKSA